jgi:predicted RNA-binding Zn-ribbon protein involved in translation (DUF1610 family)
MPPKPATCIDPDLRCALCDGELNDVSLEDSCPHCGAHIGRTLRLESIDAATMTIGDDSLCIGCGYNLRTLPVGGACPECSKPVIDSLRPDDLKFADPRWLRRVRRGVTLLLAAWLALIPLAIAMIGVSALFLSPAIGAGSLIAGVVLIAIMLTGCAALWGFIDATTCDPHPQGKMASKAPRYSARIGAALILLCMGTGVWQLIAPAAARPLGDVLLPVLPFGLSLAMLGTLVCLRRIAQRGARAPLARHTKYLSIATVVFGLLTTGHAITFVVKAQWAKAAPPAPPSAVIVREGPHSTAQIIPATTGSPAGGGTGSPKSSFASVFNCSSWPLYLLWFAALLITLRRYQRLLNEALRPATPLPRRIP